eukprot:TRINITY_DN18883_c0_g1_i1.p1 TRINITY_DN18883_c0_g1~~TRINITY_DN18883_c0_g1_i1.p1  ORF type:complete len:471 (-),score=152.65 TRINITY_DN18883_c0_g1_i1:30-1256(-)
MTTPTAPAQQQPAATGKKVTEAEKRRTAELERRKSVVKSAVDKLLENAVEPLLTNAAVPDREVEGCFLLLQHLCAKSAPACASLFDKVVGSKVVPLTVKPMLRLRILGNLYNGMCAALTAELRAATLLRVIEFATTADCCDAANAVCGQLPTAERAVAALPAEAAVEKRRKLYSLEASIWEKLGNKAEQYEAQVQYLRTFQGEQNKGKLDAVATQASALLKSRLSDVLVFAVDELLELDAVRNLKSVAASAKLLELAELLVSGTYAQFADFMKANPTALTDNVLNADDITKKMRIATLIALASAPVAAHAASANVDVPYGVIAKELLVEEGEVETWVISSVEAKAIAAKMNQLTRTAALRPLVSRRFATEDWSSMLQQLQAWRGSVAGLMQVTHAAKDHVQRAAGAAV